MTIVQQPDSLSFSQNLKKFSISSAVGITFTLKIGEVVILANAYQPGVGGVIEIDLREIVEKQLSIILPANNDAVTDQVTGVADFTATIDTTEVEFRVIKGGVADLVESASDFVDDHFLSWQSQEKKILQVQPEWLTMYATAERVVKCKAYYLDNDTIADETVTLATVPAEHLQTIDVSWAAICDAITATEPIAWDVWFEASSVRASYVQRYQLRNAGAEENVYIWMNTLGGIDSASFTGYAEDDQKLEHQIAELYTEDLDEYQIDKKTEIKQSTGFLTAREGIWLRDFFYSRKRYKIELDGSIRGIVLVESQVVNSTEDDLKQYEFTFRYSSDTSLLNLDRVVTDLPAPEGLTDFFLFELLSGLPVATYDGNLELAVQSPYAAGWMKLSFHELWSAALPGLVDGTSIVFVNGKLKVVRGETGWIDSSLIAVSYNYTTRKITLTGSTEYFWRGERKVLVSPWVSDAHDDEVGTWHLYSADGTNFEWSLEDPAIADLMVVDLHRTAAEATTFGVRQVHETMDERTRLATHTQIGAYLLSGGKPTLLSYQEDTATDLANSPSFDQAVILDEDCESTIPAWLKGTYSTLYMGPYGFVQIALDAVRPFVAEAGEYIHLNNINAGTLVPGIADRYYNVYQVLVPSTADTPSQKYRTLMLQPQRAFNTLATAIAEDPRTLSFGNILSYTPELIAYTRITYITSASDTNVGKCRIATGGITYVPGNRASQIAEQPVQDLTRKPKHGFEPAAAGTISFANSTRKFTITGTDIRLWNMGELLLKQTEDIEIDDTAGLWYISFQDNDNAENVLVASQVAWDRDIDLPVATIDWNKEESTGELKNYRYKYMEVNHSLVSESLAHPAEDISVNAENFSGIFDEHDTDLKKSLDKLDAHKHWKLFTPDYLDGFVYTSIVDEIPTLNILGNIIQNGAAYETHAEQVYTKDDLIILRDGALAGLATGQYAGFKAKLYDGITDGSLVFDKLGVARVGDVGFEQPIATRIEMPTNDHFAYWEAANLRLNFKALDTSMVSESTNLYFTNARAQAAIHFGLHANYLPYFDGTILVDSGAYWEETDYGVSPSVPGRLLELTSADDYQLRLGDGVTNPLHTYDIGRISSTGHLAFYGNQTGYIGYVFDGIDGQLLHMDNVMATFAGGITATFAAATTDVDKFIVSDTGVMKYRTGAEVLSDIGAQPAHANLTSLAGLTYASASFVKMTAAGTFQLDTATYDPAGTGHSEAAAHVTAHENAYTHANIAHGETAYGWGNHANGGYAASDHNHSGTYDPAGTGHSEAAAHVTAHENAYTHANIAHGETAYGWGNHASAGYLTSLAHNLAGDVSGAYGSTTVDKIKNKAIATLAAGFLKYDGSGFVFDTAPALITGLHANYLPYFDGTILVDSGVYWEETDYGVSPSVPGRLLELTSVDDYQLRLGDGVTNPLHTYDIGRLSSTGHLTFYGNQTGYIGYVFDGIDGQLLHLDNVMATFAGGITATFAAATTDVDKFIVSDTGVLKYRSGAEVLSDIGAIAHDGAATKVQTIVVLTQAAYTRLSPKVSSTLYAIVG